MGGAGGGAVGGFFPKTAFYRDLGLHIFFWEYNFQEDG
jgi:hypothetical protein